MAMSTNVKWMSYMNSIHFVCTWRTDSIMYTVARRSSGSEDTLCFWDITFVTRLLCTYSWELWWLESSLWLRAGKYYSRSAPVLEDGDHIFHLLSCFYSPRSSRKCDAGEEKRTFLHSCSVGAYISPSPQPYAYIIEFCGTAVMLSRLSASTQNSLFSSSAKCSCHRYRMPPF